MKKQVLAIVLVFLALAAIFSPLGTYAEESHKTKIKLKDGYITIPYEESKVKLEREETDGESRIVVRDKETGEFLSAYGVLKQGALKNQDTPNATTITTNSIVTTYSEVVKGPTTSRLYTRMDVYNYGSFRQINSVLGTWWAAASSGTWYLSDTQCSTISTSGKFPASAIQTSGNATVVVETTTTAGGELSASALQSAGFTLSGSSSTTYYYRQLIQSSYTYSVY